MTGQHRDFVAKTADLARRGEVFATAIVVGRRAPVSARLGDRAVVYADGRMDGFVGGACAREIVRKQALDAIAARQPRLVSIRPDAAEAVASDTEHVVVPMTCASEGAIDVYIEPFVRARRLVVVGATPVAAALASAAATLDYEVVRVVDAGEQRDLASTDAGTAVSALESLDEVLKTAGDDVAVVVASQGHYDEDALRIVLRLHADAGLGRSYVGLVASRKRGEAVHRLLKEEGVPGADTVRCPAGLDLGARTPPEVALSILAEITQAGSKAREASPPATRAPAAATTAVDPVCGMDVDVATARHTAEVGGVTYYFCCPHCRARFVKDPEAVLSAGR
jgi:xanthine dehydrogenase accessory factor